MRLRISVGQREQAQNKGVNMRTIRSISTASKPIRQGANIGRLLPAFRALSGGNPAALLA